MGKGTLSWPNPESLAYHFLLRQLGMSHRPERRIHSKIYLYFMVIEFALATMCSARSLSFAEPATTDAPVARSSAGQSEVPTNMEDLSAIKTPDDLVKAPLDTKKLALGKMLDRQNNAIGKFVLGSQGQMLSLGMRPDALPEVLYAIREDRGLVLVPAWPPDAESYARVSRDGQIVLQSVLKSKETAAAPESWPYRDGAGQLSIPPSGSVLQRSAIEQKTAVNPPEGTIGKMFLTKAGGLLFLTKGNQTVENILWVVKRNDGGFDLVHSGPAAHGIYLTVGLDRKIIYADKTRSANPDAVWPVIDESRHPVVFADGDVHWVPQNLGTKAATIITKMGHYLAESSGE